MSRRKGELTNAAIDREWPYQVALLDDLCVQRNYDIIHRFCEPLSVSPRNRTVTAVWPNGKNGKFRLYCFADWTDAQAFIDEFGGMHFDPKTDRVKGRRNAWKRTEEWTRVLESGPLRVPEILRT